MQLVAHAQTLARGGAARSRSASVLHPNTRGVRPPQQRKDSLSPFMDVQP